LIGRLSHLEAIRDQKGLRVLGKRSGLYPIDITTEIPDLPDGSIVIVTVKAFHLQKALEALAPRVNSSHLIVLIQNGLGIHSLAEETLQIPVVRGVTFIAAAMEAPGRVSVNAIGKTYFSTTARLQSLWERAALPCVEVEDIEKYVWRKLAINAVINPLSALLKVRNGELVCLQDPSRGLVRELVLVAQAEGGPEGGRDTGEDSCEHATDISQSFFDAAGRQSREADRDRLDQRHNRTAGS